MCCQELSKIAQSGHSAAQIQDFDRESFRMSKSFLICLVNDSGCGTVDSTVASDTREPGFE